MLGTHDGLHADFRILMDVYISICATGGYVLMYRSS